VRTCLLILTLILPAPGVPQKAGESFDPTGAWAGPCKSEKKTEGTLEVTFQRKGKGWTATGGLKTPGYPQDDSPFEEVKVQGESVSFLGIWGPTLAEFSGVHSGGKITGKLEGKNGERVVFGCQWVLARHRIIASTRSGVSPSKPGCSPPRRPSSFPLFRSSLWASGPWLGRMGNDWAPLGPPAGDRRQ
jgi:hypothetical protein